MHDSKHDGKWRGDNPYFLAIRQYGPERSTTVIDLDSPWLTEHADLMRVPGSWMLCSKKASEAAGVLVPIIVKQVEEGEQPFYAKRHIGVVSMGGSQGIESVSHGIGVKERDGRVDGVFILPNGSLTTDDDVYWVGDKMNKGQL